MSQHTSQAKEKGKEQKYPYPSPCATIPLYEDPYLRDPTRLMSSLARFSFLASTGEIPFHNDNLRPLLPILNRYCDNQSTADDMKHLLRIYPPPSHHQRHIYPPQLLCMETPAIMNAIGNLDKLGEVIFLDGTLTGEWTIFLVFVKQRRIEVFVVGDIKKKQVASRTKLLMNFLKQVLPNQDLQPFFRVRFPPKPSVDNGSLTFVLVHYLYQHGKYLDLDADTIRMYKLSAIAPLSFPYKNFLLCHDTWFGYSRTHPSKKPWHPFIVTVSNGIDEFKESLNNNGWVVIDVDGDGTCGFYCFILGLELYNDLSFSVNTNNPPLSPMIKNKPWQFCVMRMRHQLAQASRDLISREYPDGIFVQELDVETKLEVEKYPWFQYTMAGTDEEFFELGEWFIAEDLQQIDYFNRTLVEAGSQYTEYQMNPYWGSLVFSYHFSMRVIVYTRTASFTTTPITDDDEQRKTSDTIDGLDATITYDEKAQTKTTVTYSWSTHVIDHSVHFKERIITEVGLKRMSDKEFKRKPTIEWYIRTVMLPFNQRTTITSSWIFQP